MKATIYPGKAQGSIVIPPSKSMSHRAIICAALAHGKSTISNVAYSDDIKITIAGMQQLGAKITCLENSVIVEGIKNFKGLKKDTIFCKESGSTLRFFIPIFSLCNKTISFTGENRLLKRPQTIYEDIFTSQGIPYLQDEDKIQINGSLKSGKYSLQGDVSSQFISGLLFTLPLLEEDSVIHIEEPYESRSYVDLTLEMLERYGIKASYVDANTLHVPGKQIYIPCDYKIEGDYSQLGFFAVLAAINNGLDCLGLSHNSKQGDKQIIDILKQANVKVEEIENGYRIHKSEVSACAIDLQDCPDLGPILNVLAMYAKGNTRIYNAQRLRYKESDRIAAMEEELIKCGVQMQTCEGEILIDGAPSYDTNEILSGHKDHRIVMSLSVASTLFATPTTIEGAQAIDKSYPTFFDDLKKLGIKVDIQHD